ncbi:MAG: aldehyde dehydrogenase family protein [Tepidisphaeraceae bacterium]
MADLVPLLIDSDRITTTNTADVISPWTGQTVHKVCLADAAVIEQTIASSQAAFEKTKRQPPHERAELLLRVAAELKARRNDFAALITLESGKPITLAEAEVDRAIITFTDSAEQARSPFSETLDAAGYAPGVGQSAIARRFPVGVVLGIGPFNFPLNLVAHKVAPAIACGATIVLKPSPRTPAVALKLAETILACGGTPGQVNILHCDNAAVHALLDDARIKVVTFTGSAAVGWQLKAKAVKQKVTLELGGNAAVIVHADADLAAAVPAIATGAFANAGQSCISVQRIFAHADIYDEFRDRLVAYTKENIVTGDPSRRDVLNGPMIDRPTLERAVATAQDAVAAGGYAWCGGTAEGPCLLPTIIENVPAGHRLVAEEAFAPVAVLSRYGDFEKAIAAVNASRYGLQAGVFTRDTSLVAQAFERLDVGGVLINQTPTARLDPLPYGGVKDSGVGREGPRYAIEDMTELRTLVIKH